MKIYNSKEIGKMIRHCKDVHEVVVLSIAIDSYMKVVPTNLSRSSINIMACKRIDQLTRSLS